MMKNKLRRALLDNEVTAGAWMQIGHPAVAEVFARAGFDWIVVDLEHGAIDLETMTNIFRTIDAFDCVPVARLPLNDPIWIHRSLDAGARGLIIPMVHNAAAAEAAVREAKYPPRGGRGFGYSRANLHGMDFAAYIESANEEIAMVMQIEHIQAIENLEQIIAVAGVDGVLIGPLDLSGSMGLTGQMDHPEVAAALARYRETCRAHGISYGLHVVRPNQQNIKAARDQGYTLLPLGLDNVFLDDMSRYVLGAARE